MALESPTGPPLNDIRTNIVDFDVAAAFIDKQTIVIPDRANLLGPSPVGLSPSQLAQVGRLSQSKGVFSSENLSPR
jgi:hypothetical protein